MRVLLQAGHYPNGGGAPGEKDWAWELAHRLAARLAAADVETVIVGDWLRWAPPAKVRQDADLFCTLHYDAAIYGAGRNSGCFADRAVDETRPEVADRFIALWEARYPAATGIPLCNERRNANTNQYYAFRALTWGTPGIILEHGCGAPVGTGGYPPGDDAVFLHDRLETVAELDAEAILAFLDLPAASDPPPAPDRVAVLAAALAEANAIKSEFEQTLRALEGRRRLKRGTTDRLIAAGRG